MAPPPSASTPLMQRLLTMGMTLQFAWFTGHLSLLFCIFRYSFSWIRMNYYGGWAQFTYRTAFVSAAVTYGIVVYKTLRARSRSRQPINGFAIAADENVQYLLMALVWLFTPQYPLAMLPYGIYSIFHVATYIRANVIPTISPPKQVAPVTGASPNAKPTYATHPAADTIGNFVKEYYDASMSIVSALEILLFGRLFLAAICFQRRSWIMFIIYFAFLRARYSQSNHVQTSFKQIEVRGDDLVGAQNTPPVVRSGWVGIKNFVRHVYRFTDLSRWFNGAAVPKKTS